MKVRAIVLSALALSLMWCVSPASAHDKKEHAGHGAGLGEPGDPDKVTRTVKVEMSDAMRFDPSTIPVKRGETIRFIAHNAGQTRHEMVLGSKKELKEHAALMRRFPDMEHADPNQVSVEPGQTGELIWHLTHAGTFDFACLRPGHFEAGMVGKLAVK
jgi:uncharacterized cupredoxin-like copper-binding protein